MAARKKTFLEAIAITERQINDIMFLCETRLKPTYFTRSHCKMDFRSIVLFQLNFVKRTLQLELDDFSDIVNGGEKRITKQGYSEARQKISPKAFISMTDEIVDWYYKDDDFKTFRGYRLCAIDASIVQLPNTKRLRDTFGYSEGRSDVKRACAKVAGIYDLENGLMISSTIDRYRVGERDLARFLIADLEQKGLKNDLIVFDRGYTGGLFYWQMQKAGIKFLIRASDKNKQIQAAYMPDQIIDYVVSKTKTVRLRVIRLLLDSGEEEVLVTNLLDENLDRNGFKDLYFKRWGIESKFDELKNRLQIQNFSGETPIAIEQDFYASMYLTNMATLAKNEADEKIADCNEGKQLKFEYKVNMNILLGKLKNRLILMLLEPDPDKRATEYRKIMLEVSRNVVPIRPGRQNPRTKGLRATKHPRNQKRAF